MRIIISILLLPFMFFYGKSFVGLIPMVSLSDPLQTGFIIAFVASTILFFMILRSEAYIATFEHELTHNLFAILSLKKPVGFHVNRDGGGQFEYRGRGNIFITLAPYFFQTFTFLLLPLYLVFSKEHHLLFFIAFGITTGFHTSTTIKEFGYHQTDLRENGTFLSTVVVIFLSIITYGIILSFVVGRWSATGTYLASGISDLFQLIKQLL